MLSGSQKGPSNWDLPSGVESLPEEQQGLKPQPADCECSGGGGKVGKGTVRTLC